MDVGHVFEICLFVVHLDCYISHVIFKKILAYAERFGATTCDMVINVVSSILKIMVLNYLG